jgi:pyridoxine kinase
MGNVQTLLNTQKWLEKLKEKHPECLLFLDPVMGDNGKLYVPKEMIPVYQQLCTVADVVFPNAFEAEQVLFTFKSIYIYINIYIS